MHLERPAVCDPGYEHVQRAPWGMGMLIAGALGWLLAAWSHQSQAESGSTIVLIVVGSVLILAGLAFQTLRVADAGAYLLIQFGPLPLFRKRIRYDRIRSVEVGRTTLLDGWGIHLSLRGGWVWNIWGWDCVVVSHHGITRIGTDDPEGLAAFLRSRIRSVSP